MEKSERTHGLDRQEDQFLTWEIHTHIQNLKIELENWRRTQIKAREFEFYLDRHFINGNCVRGSLKMINGVIHFRPLTSDKG